MHAVFMPSLADFLSCLPSTEHALVINLIQCGAGDRLIAGLQANTRKNTFHDVVEAVRVHPILLDISTIYLMYIYPALDI